MRKFALILILVGQNALSLPPQMVDAGTASAEVNQVIASENVNSVAKELLTKRLADLNLLRTTIVELQSSLQSVNTGDTTANKLETFMAASSLTGHIYAGVQYIAGDATNAFHFRYLANFLALITAGISTTNSKNHDPSTSINKVDELLTAISQLKQHTSNEKLKKSYSEVSSTLLDLRSDLSATQTNVQANQAYTYIWASNAFTLGKSNFLFNVVCLSAYLYTWSNIVTNLNRPLRFRLESQINHIVRQIDSQMEMLSLEMNYLK